MRYITADYIFPVSSPPMKNGVVVINDDGVVQDILTSFQQEKLNSKPETFRGIIIPGFINAHCHLELSHLKGKFTEKKGLSFFIKEVLTKREAPEKEIKEAIVCAEDEMIANGIVGVGDISNVSQSFDQKKKGRIKYHTFIEVFDLNPDEAEKVFEKGIAEMKTGSKHLQFSLTPHAPYTVSSKLLKLINDYAYANDALISIHNQETESENEMFRERKGELFETLSGFGKYYERWKATGFNSLASTMVHLPICNKILLVHNTYTEADDITWAHLYGTQMWWCFCPNANLFIENRLPDFQMFIDAGCRIVVGTDSYASNWSLSVLDELKTISKHAPKIPLQTLLQWATLNGAEFYEWKKELGSIEKGKRPGLNLLENVDLEKLQLMEDTTVRKIV